MHFYFIFYHDVNFDQNNLWKFGFKDGIYEAFIIAALAAESLATGILNGEAET